MKLPYIVYAILRLAEGLLSSASRFINSQLPGGSTSLSVSSRAVFEESPGWALTRRIIDLVFWPQSLFTGLPHCQWSLAREEINIAKTQQQIADMRARASRSGTETPIEKGHV